MRCAYTCITGNWYFFNHAEKMTICHLCGWQITDRLRVIAAVRNGHEACLQHLIQSGCPVDFYSQFNLINGVPFDLAGYTPLMMAVMRGHVSIVRILLASGAEITRRRWSDGHTAISLSAVWRRPECAQILINAGADIHVQGIFFHTPLMFSCLREDLQLIRIFLNAGANVNLGIINQSPLMAAIYSFECVRELVSAGADVNFLDTNGGTALLRAIDADVVKYLYQHGTRLNTGLSENPSLNGDCLLVQAAAGEQLNVACITLLRNFPEVWPVGYSRVRSLKHQCRLVIRTELLSMTDDSNLFLLVPSLPLPSLVMDYLLFGQYL